MNAVVYTTYQSTLGFTPPLMLHNPSSDAAVVHPTRFPGHHEGSTRETRGDYQRFDWGECITIILLDYLVGIHIIRILLVRVRTGKRFKSIVNITSKSESMNYRASVANVNVILAKYGIQAKGRPMQIGEKVCNKVDGSFALSAGVLALVALINWAGRSFHIADGVLFFILMAPTTAICTILLSFSLIVNNCDLSSWRLRKFSLPFSASVLLYSLSVVLAYAFHWSWHPEAWIVSNHVGPNGLLIGAMSPLTATVLGLLSIAFILGISVVHSSKWFKVSAFNIAVFCSIICFIVFLGYATGMPLIPRIMRVPMVMSTSIAVFLLSLSLIFNTGRDRYPLSLFNTKLSGMYAYSSRFRISAFFTFAILGITISVLSVIFLKMEAKSFKENVTEQLISITELKVNQVNWWLEERIANAKVIETNVSIRPYVFEQLYGKSSIKNTYDIQNWMNSIVINYEFSAAALLDTSGLTVLTSPQGLHFKEIESIPAYQQAVKTKSIVLEDLSNDDKTADSPDNKIHLRFWVPLTDNQDPEQEVKAIVLLQLDPDITLYPLIQTWPGPSRSAETLLVRADGENALFLNELRHNKAKSMSLRMNIKDNPRVLASQALQGKLGITEGTDYRGEAVIGVISKIKYHPWYMITKIDQEEIYSPLRVRGWFTGGVILLLIVVSGLAVGLQARKRDLAINEKVTSEWQATFDSVHDVVWLLDNNYKIVRTNRACSVILGKEPEEIIGKFCWEIMHDSAGPRERCPVAISKETQIRGESEILYHDKVLRITADPIINDNGNMTGSVHIMSDITERIHSEQELVANQQRLMSIINNAPFGAHTYQLTDDDELILIGANASADNILQLENEPLLGMEMEQAFPNLKDTDLPRIYRRVARSGENYITENMVYKSNDITGAFEVHAMNIGANKMTAFFRDITEKKRAEQEILRLNESLENRVRDRTLQLETSNRELEAFSYSVSHDLRSPLRSINGWSHALSEDYIKDLDDTALQYLDRISSEANRMGALIDALLAFSKMTRIDFNATKINLSEVATQSCQRLQELHPEQQVKLEIEPNVWAFADKYLMDIVMTNLLHNALKFSRNRELSVVTFGTKTVDGKIVYFVSDNGVGFDEQYMDKLFQPFQRLHKMEEFSGTGIGLATVQRIIQRHGGTVWASSVPDELTILQFTLS